MVKSIDMKKSQIKLFGIEFWLCIEDVGLPLERYDQDCHQDWSVNFWYFQIFNLGNQLLVFQEPYC